MGGWGPVLLDFYSAQARFRSNLTQFREFKAMYSTDEPLDTPGAMEWSCPTHSNLVSTSCVLGGWVRACVTWFLFHLSPIAIQIKFDANWGNFGCCKLVLWLPYIIVLCEVPGIAGTESFPCAVMFCHGACISAHGLTPRASECVIKSESDFGAPHSDSLTHILHCNCLQPTAMSNTQQFNITLMCAWWVCGGQCYLIFIL